MLEDFGLHGTGGHTVSQTSPLGAWFLNWKQLALRLPHGLAMRILTFVSTIHFYLDDYIALGLPPLVVFK